MTAFPKDPLWYRDAVIYQLHVKTFHDSNADGVGDFRGLMEKLSYLEELGVTAIWLLPFYPSPLKDDGYDTADYYDVHPDYGTLEDFQAFLAEAHRRGLRVITELVLNHTSDQNAWFQKSRRAAPGSEWRDFYVWSDTPQKYEDARIIFKDFEHSNWSWDPVARAYFWHRFYAHQPDLNFDNPKVHDELLKVIDFWLEMGVDGVRLDAVPYLYEREGTNCENLPETHAFLQKLRAHIDSKFEDRMLLAEANQWPEDAVDYFGTGDKCQMAFHFPLMPRMFMALQMEDRFPIIDILDQTPAIPETCQWAIFLRNHDELTLEMVTDEERDYMYRMYASDTRARINLGIRRRLAPLLANSRRKIELINILLFSLPGTPIIYYGDEIGMGDNIYLGDRNGVRTPMQWSSDRNAGFSKCNPQQLFLPITIDPEYHYEAVNVENQEKNLSSLLWWMRRVVAMRKRYKALGSGTIEFLAPDNNKVLTFIRRFEDELVLVVVNLSRFSQVMELDLSQFAGMTPVEVFSQNRFPAVKAGTPYLFTLGSHDHYWLHLQPAEVDALSGKHAFSPPALPTEPNWEQGLSEKDQEMLEEKVLPGYIRSARWFGGKARAPRTFRIIESVLIGEAPQPACVLFVRVDYPDGNPETYMLPLQIGTREETTSLAEETPQAVVATLPGDGMIFDAIYSDRFRAALLKLIVQSRSINAASGQISGFPGSTLRELLGEKNVSVASQVLKAEQSNSSIIYDNKLFLKLYRRLEEGVNPDAEIMRFLSEKQKFPHVPPFGGSIEYRKRGSEPRVLGLLLGMVQNEGDAWNQTLDAVGRFYERVLAAKPEVPERHPVPLLAQRDCASAVAELIGGVYPERARQLGVRTGEMHLALAAEPDDAVFAPEPFTTLYQRSLYQSLRASVRKLMQVLEKQLPQLPEDTRAAAEELLRSEKQILDRQSRLLGTKIEAAKTRFHGDYHLGQVLNTGKDFVIIDFEGEPIRSLSERKLKRSPLRDVAGMLRSFQYAAYQVLRESTRLREEDRAQMQPWAEEWAECISRIFLRAYLETTAGAPFLPKEPEQVETLLNAFILDKAIYEVGYELNNRPSWVGIPIRGIQQILGS